MIDRALFALEGIRGALAALVALAVARALLVVGQAWSLASAIVHLWEGAPLPDQAPLIVLFFLCFVGGQLVRYAQDSYLDRYAYARIDALRRELLQAVFGQGARIVQAQGTGSVTAMVLEGIDQVETYLASSCRRSCAWSWCRSSCFCACSRWIGCRVPSCWSCTRSSCSTWG